LKEKSKEEAKKGLTEKETLYNQKRGLKSRKGLHIHLPLPCAYDSPIISVIDSRYFNQDDQDGENDQGINVLFNQ
jgi:hypothetical protein